MIDKIKHIFEVVYGEFSGNRLYELKLGNEMNKKHMRSFHSLLQKEYAGSIDEEFLLNFIVFQFRNYENTRTRLGKRKVHIQWILGKKALERWKEKPENWLYFNNRFIKKHNIKIEVSKKEKDLSSEKFTKSKERRRFLNQERGYIHCMELDLFERYSKECVICMFKTICSNGN